MAKIFKPFFATKILNDHVQFTSADAADTVKLMTTAGADGANVNSIAVSNSDASSVVIELHANANGGSAVEIGSMTIPARAGYDGTASINLLDITNMPFLQADGSLAIQALEEISVSNATTLGGGTVVNVVAFVADFEV